MFLLLRLLFLVLRMFLRVRVDHGLNILLLQAKATCLDRLLKRFLDLWNSLLKTNSSRIFSISIQRQIFYLKQNDVDVSFDSTAFSFVEHDSLQLLLKMFLKNRKFDEEKLHLQLLGRFVVSAKL